MSDSIEVDFPGLPPASGDVESRTIRGIAAPPDATTQRWGRTLRIPHGSVTLADRVVVLRDHDETRATGRLVSGEWTDRGLEVVLKVSQTPAGDEVLQLAADGVLSLSLGLSFSQDDLRTDGDEVELTRSTAFEISTTPFPALAGAEIYAVTFADTATTTNQLHTGATMSNDDTAALTETIASLRDAVVTLSDRPAPAPAPALPAVQREAPQPFPAEDFKLTLSGRDQGAADRLNAFMIERFSSTTVGDAKSLQPDGFLPALYVAGSPPFSRVLTQFLTQAGIKDINAFSFAKLTNPGGPFISAHTAGVEPTVADSPVWGLTTIQPTALSGKVSVLQEVADLSSAQVLAMIWDMVVMAAEKEMEARVAAMLDGLTLPVSQVIDLSGNENADLADAFDELHLDLKNPDRFSGMVCSPALYKAFTKARDGDGRKLFPAVGATNADGTANGRKSIDLNGVTAVASKDITHSYIVDKKCVHQWSSPIQRFDLKTMVKSVEVGAFMYEAHCVNDLSGVVRVEFTP